MLIRFPTAQRIRASYNVVHHGKNDNSKTPGKLSYKCLAALGISVGVSGKILYSLKKVLSTRYRHRLIQCRL